MLIPLIALSGPIGSGKSTIAKFLVETHNYQLVKFAQPLKSMLRALGLTYDHLEGHLKETPCPLLGGQTPRFAMQTLGTEWGRELISPTLWTDAWKSRVEEILATGGRVVVDDLRFANEAAEVQKLGGKIIKLSERTTVFPTTHISEELAFANYNWTIQNKGTIEQLLARVACLNNKS